MPTRRCNGASSRLQTSSARPPRCRLNPLFIALPPWQPQAANRPECNTELHQRIAAPKCTARVNSGKLNTHAKDPSNMQQFKSIGTQTEHRTQQPGKQTRKTPAQANKQARNATDAARTGDSKQIRATRALLPGPAICSKTLCCAVSMWRNHEAFVKNFCGRSGQQRGQMRCGMFGNGRQCPKLDAENSCGQDHGRGE